MARAFARNDFDQRRGNPAGVPGGFILIFFVIMTFVLGGGSRFGRRCRGATSSLISFA